MSTLLDSVHAAVVRYAREQSLGWRTAVELAFAVERVLRDRLGGQTWYVPVAADDADKALRDREIREAYDGSNRDTLCRRYGISRRMFYSIMTARLDTVSLRN